MRGSAKARLTEGPIGSTLIRLTFPMLVGIMGVVVFNLVDTYFVGQLGTTELAAITFTFPVVFIIGALSRGLGTGSSVVVSRAIGGGNREEVKRLTTDSLVLSTLIVGLLVFIGLLTIEPAFRLLGASESELPYIKDYMYIWYPGMVFLVVPMVGNNIIRATGDTKTPMKIMLAAMGINIALDPVLIFGLGPIPAMGMRGAAIATVIARSTAFILTLWVLYTREGLITLRPPSMTAAWSSWKRFLYIGLPSGATHMIIPLGIGVITRLVSAFGPAAVAATGVASRVEMFALMIIMALASVVGPFVGQNAGARRYDRLRTGVRLSRRFALVWGVAMIVVLALAARPIGTAFSDNQAVIDFVTLYLRTVPLCYGLLGVVMITNITFNALNKPFYAAILTIAQMFVLYIPLAYLGSYLWGVLGIFGASSVARILSGIGAFVWLRHVLATKLHPTPMEKQVAEPIIG